MADAGFIPGDVQHGALTANTVATVTLDGDYEAVEILQRGDGLGGALADIFALVDSGATDPTVGGQGATAIPAGAGSAVILRSADGTTTAVKLISEGACEYSVTGLRT